ncbi:phage tail protein I [Cognatishimia sp. MH4019]|uniref:phage tail protein I n=1 Tax=Cognatishimia sp. MH4019 TaxID=2854030 RepID=UPI001CD438D6|nr:phage tail protein I [Cognatishimia sp. MH4019]
MTIEQLVSGLLPSNATKLERALVETAFERLEDVGICFDTLWNPMACPKEVLPHLAFALSADEWDPEWPEAVQRNYLKEWPSIVRRKGTLPIIKRALEVAGYGDAIITEAFQYPRIGGAPALGDTWRLGPDGSVHWADYWIEVTRPITLRAARRLGSIVRAVAPKHCRLRAITVRGVQYTIGDNLWPIGDEIALGASYHWEALNA